MTGKKSNKDLTKYFAKFSKNILNINSLKIFILLLITIFNFPLLSKDLFSQDSTNAKLFELLEKSLTMQIKQSNRLVFDHLLIASETEEKKAENAAAYLRSAKQKSDNENYSGAISDCTEAIQTNTNNRGLLELAYEFRALNKLVERGISDKKSICFDLRQASSLGSDSATKTFYQLCDN